MHTIGQKRPSDSVNGDDRNNGGDNFEPNKKKRRQVKRACLNCRIAHAACDNGRPCTRCVQYGLEVSCLDVERKNSKKRKEGTLGQLGQLGQLGTLAGLNQLLQLPNITNSMGPPTPPSSYSQQYQHPTQQTPNHEASPQRSDIPHNVYLTHEYYPILTQLAAKHNTLLQVIQQQMQPKASPSSSPSPHHTQQSYNPVQSNYLPPISTIPPGNSMSNFVNNIRTSSSGLANIQMQLAQSSPRREQPNNIPPPPSSKSHPSPPNGHNSQYGSLYGTEYQNEPESPPSPPPRIFKPHLLQQAQLASPPQQQPQRRLQTPDVFMENDETIDIVKNAGEDLSSFFIDDYFTKMIMHGRDPGDQLQTFDEEDYGSNFQTPQSATMAELKPTMDTIKLCQDEHRETSGCVVFPPQPASDHNHGHDELMCVAVWELEGTLYSANYNFMEAFKVPNTIRLAKKNQESNGNEQVLYFEELLPKNDIMFKPMLKSILNGKSPAYTGPMQFIDYEKSKSDTPSDERLNGFASCYLVRGGVHQDPRYFVTHISIVREQKYL
jgi:hypothetical protein